MGFMSIQFLELSTNRISIYVYEENPTAIVSFLRFWSALRNFPSFPYFFPIWFVYEVMTHSYVFQWFFIHMSCLWSFFQCLIYVCTSSFHAPLNNLDQVFYESYDSQPCFIGTICFILGNLEVVFGSISPLKFKVL